MKKLMYILPLIALIFLSCERRPLLELSSTHYVRVYINENIKNITEGFYNENYERPHYDSPDVLRLILADPATGIVKAERFLRNIGEDERGIYYDGYIYAEPGTYSLMAYNFDTETTVVTNSNNCTEAKAYTNVIASHISSNIPSRNQHSSDEKIVYDPDHLFAANCGEVKIGYNSEVDTLRTPEGDHFTAESIVKSYYLQVHVKGLEFVSTSIGLLSGMSGSSYINGSGMIENDPVTIYFEMLPGMLSGAAGISKTNTEGITTIYTTFSTFGKIENAQNALNITFDFHTIYGEPYSETLNITDLFYTELARDKQWLLIEHTINIPEPPKVGGDGGFKPTVNEWGDIKSELEL
ncbi:MAG: DUF5119 domain-containing protein [Bacteroidales bacterium]|nr:DUF5119 domain-containing protein [Bacteroidales bacterium]